MTAPAAPTACRDCLADPTAEHPADRVCVCRPKVTRPPLAANQCPCCRSILTFSADGAAWCSCGYAEAALTPAAVTFYAAVVASATTPQIGH